jgi:hypothetical protein
MSDPTPAPAPQEVTAEELAQVLATDIEQVLGAAQTWKTPGFWALIFSMLIGVLVLFHAVPVDFGSNATVVQVVQTLAGLAAVAAPAAALWLQHHHVLPAAELATKLTARLQGFRGTVIVLK